jgi:hypothetical protein
MANSLMFYNVEVHVCITQVSVCVCVCVCVCVLTVQFNVFVTGRHIFSLVCVCVWVYIWKYTFSLLPWTVFLYMLSSYIYTYMLITTFRVYTYIILLHSINKLSETLQNSLDHITILLSQHLTHWRLVSPEPFTYPHITCTSSSCRAKINICLWKIMW